MTRFVMQYKIKNIIFDFDGTLFDTREGILESISYTLKKVNKKNLILKKQIIGPPISKIFKTIFPFENDKFIAFCVKTFRSEYGRNGILKTYLIKGIHQILLELEKKEISILIVSNKPKIYIKKILKFYNLLHIFKYIEAPAIKEIKYDKNTLLRNAIKKNKLKAKETIMIGDKADDIIAAKKNNLMSLGITFGFGLREELLEAGADKIFNSSKDLKQYLNSI